MFGGYAVENFKESLRSKGFALFRDLPVLMQQLDFHEQLPERHKEMQAWTKQGKGCK